MQENLKTKNNSSKLISLEHVTKYYKKGQKPALRNISLSLHTAEIVAIVGPSGSGKSTLLNLIGCLDRPSDGSVYINGLETKALSDSKLSDFRSRKIGFVFQSYQLQPSLTVLENVLVPAMFAGRNKQESSVEALSLLKAVGIDSKSNCLPSRLSGGEMQRTAIARALINKPALIIADEPTGNLDVDNTKNVLSIFKTIRDEFRTAIILVTHDERVAQFADRTIRLSDGEIYA